MFIYYFMIASIFLILFLWFGLDIVRDVKILNLPHGFFYKTFYILIYLIVFISTINVILSFIIYITTKNKIGSIGDKGLKGLKGENGNDGICNITCGQKSCYVGTIDHMNKYYQKRTKNKQIKNKYFLNKINEICHSKEYQNILNKDDKIKPSEQKLINFIKKLSIIWLNEILKNPKGKQFLESNEDPNNYWDPSEDSPFDEIRKYDLWNLSEPKKNRVILRKECLYDDDLPKAPDPPLSIKKSNNYYPVYWTSKNPNQHGPNNCPYYQLGYNNTNPRRRRWCWFSKGAPSWGEFTWVTKKRTRSTKPFSIYNPIKYYDKKGKKGRKVFYPLGSVWDNSNFSVKRINNKCLPKVPNTCPGINRHYNLGPEQTTLLVSGDVKKPIGFKKKWHNKKNCQNCQPSYINATIWEPIPPPGYICLGDYAWYGNNPPSKDSIRCIPKKCVKKLPLGNKIWSPDGISESKYRTRNDYLTNRNYGSIEKPEKVSIFSAGHSQKDFKSKNDEGGYNLFRSNLGNEPPTSFDQNGSTYIIKEECYIPKKVEKVTSDKSFNKNSNKAIGVLGYPNRDSKYSIDSYLNKVNLGVLSHTNNDKKYYIKHSGSKKENEYFLQAYNRDKNNFNDCFNAEDDSLTQLPECNKNNPNQIFKIVSMKDQNNNLLTNKNTDNPLVKLKSKTTGKCFSFKVDDRGIGIPYQEKCDNSQGPHIWDFKSVSGNIYNK